MTQWLRDFIDFVRRQKRADRATIAQATYNVFTTPPGRILLKHLEDEFYFTISHAQGLNGRDTAFNEGQRSVVQLFHDLMQEAINPQGVPKVETEERSNG